MGFNLAGQHPRLARKIVSFVRKMTIVTGHPTYWTKTSFRTAGHRSHGCTKCSKWYSILIIDNVLILWTLKERHPYTTVSFPAHLSSVLSILIRFRLLVFSAIPRSRSASLSQLMVPTWISVPNLSNAALHLMLFYESFPILLLFCAV